MEMTDKFITVKDVQEHLGLGKDKVYSLVRLKSFPKIKIGNTYHIPEVEYLKWLENNIKNKTNIII